ncbi:MAG: pilus assembly FimT family protein [Actinomycetota bacterium]
MPGGKVRPDLSNERGFTLIEVAVVLGIITILAGLGAYALISYWRAQALTGATNQMLTDLRDAQARARAEATILRVKFKPADEAYEIARFTGPLVTDYELLERKVLDVGIDLQSASFDGGSTIYFQPRGVATDAAGTIVDGSVVIRSIRLDQDRQISVTGLTARAQVQ